MKNYALSLPSILCLSLLPFKSASAIDFKPQLNGIVNFEFQNDWAYDSDDTTTEVNTLSTTVEPYFILSFNDRFALEAGLTFEPVQPTDPNDDTIFENEGLYVQELKAVYSGDDFALYAGKYNPAFGTAWDLAPGIYGADFVEDYELTERIGFGGSYTIETEKSGNHTLSGNAFFADTSVLSESTITKRGRTKKGDGGVSNTEDFSSFSLTLDSEFIAGIDGLNTHIGYYNQSDGDADIGLNHEKAFALGANYNFSVSENIEAMIMSEWVGIRNSAGSNDDVNYLTTSLGLMLYNNWNFAASYTNRDTDVSGGSDATDYVYQLSAGYAFDNGISFDAGYRGSEESNIDTHILGALVTYTYEF